MPANAPGSPAIRLQETAAIRMLKTAAIVGILSIVVGTFLPYVVTYAEGAPNPFTAFGLVTPIGSGNNTSLSVSASAVGLLDANVGVALVVVLVGLVLYYLCFARLKTFDARFATPATLTIVFMVGLGLVVLGVLVTLSALTGANGCDLGRTPTPPCATALLNSLLEGLAVLLVSLIVVLVGAVGFLVGLWRIGTRYGNSMLHVATILYLIPFVNLVAPILTLLAAREIERRIAAGGLGAFVPPPLGFPGPPQPPVPPA